MYLKLPTGAKPSKSAGSDQTRPILTRGELVETDGEWSIVTTDSYQLAVVRLQVCEDNEPGDLVAGPIPPDALKAIEKARAFRAGDTIDPCNPYGAAVGAAYRRDDNGAFPDHTKLMPEWDDEFRVGLNPYRLADLAASLGVTRSKNSMVVLTMEGGGRARPIIVTTANGNQSEGLLMPVRLNA